MAQEVFFRDDFRYADDDARLWEAGLYVWDTSELEWVKMTQPMVEVSGDVIANFDDVETLLTEGNTHQAKKYRKHVLFDNPSATVMYVGKSTTHKASQSTGDLWWIWKYTKTAAGVITAIEGPLNGNWDGRASLAWAA